ncbi:glucosaminidase domain-containing protein [Francisella adeliensis]|uniref:BAX protein n=1 Tax=Francisella adeliensis TaxID=2007306 RepID=A0A2Z4XZC6_9GAMM|nr:glucosaminidase domain-containing protein [Francisella adeliensis]AXA33783.1 BAX protein [Francisella adeliensis]MBK2085682.1 glucosaminidase domain-containing protein [Francisella adeliensis]MBK2097560.1 glucosaminidase domain-containing protein [Francisella adeliensis]QIW12018.1 BAX protein [Francisella adeliensis]QIW13893.1 BAX protein [Francisella adeliensis]
MKNLMSLMKAKYMYFIIILISAFILSTEPNINVNDKYHLATKASYNETKPDFNGFKNVNEKKEAFITYMLDAIRIANNEICGEKKQVNKLTLSYKKNKTLNENQQQKLDLYIDYYKISRSNSISKQLQYLDIKLGTTPTSFLLAQAILESGWGTSRFARDYNNYFGLHCFKKGCGVKANRADVYLEVFKSADDSILGYYHRLNTGSKFEAFRIARDKVNQKQLSIDDLLNTLDEYSELNEGEYQTRLKSVIKYNKLDQYDKLLQC